MATIQNDVSRAVDAVNDLAGKYLTFKLGNEEYALEILKVREIMGLMEITAVPRTPDFVRGIINLRGKVIPVVDLRVKFGMNQIEDSEQTCVIVVDVTKENNSVEMGILVDSVSEVLDIANEDIENAPSFGSTVDTTFILGMAKTKDSVKILLNIQKVMLAGELATVTNASLKVKNKSEDKATEVKEDDVCATV
jgi:purine-binding chemotaxis protein CheW